MTRKEVEVNIGSEVEIVGADAQFDHRVKNMINGKWKITIEKITNNGEVQLKSGNDFCTVPCKSIKPLDK